MVETITSALSIECWIEATGYTIAGWFIRGNYSRLTLLIPEEFYTNYFRQENQQRMWSFDRFFKEVTNILSKKVLHVFYVNRTSSIEVNTYSN